MSDCTRCGTPGAYVAISTVECKNPECPCFSERLMLREHVEEALQRCNSVFFDPRVRTLEDFAYICDLPGEE